MSSNLEEKVTQCLVAANLTMPQLAEKMGLSEPELTTLCRHGDPRLSEVVQLAKCLRVLPTYFLNGSFNQAGIGNTQKIKIGKAAAHELAEQFGVCRRALDKAQGHLVTKDALLASKNDALASKDALIASQAEMLGLLRGEYNRPN